MISVDVQGPWFEDLSVDREFSAPAVTLTEGHACFYQALFGDRMRLPLDHEAGRAVTRHPAPLAHPLLVANVAIGQTTWASQRVKANLGYRGVLFERPVYLGDTLSTRTRVVGRRRNRARPERAPTGVVALESTTCNQRGETVLHFWRFPMIAARPEATPAAAETDLDQVGADVTRDALLKSLPKWDTSVLRASSGEEPRVGAGTRFKVCARDTVTAAAELVRLTLNLAAAHSDAAASHLGSRLVYGGHVISMAFAQVTRALPDLLTMMAWSTCDHLAPVFEGDWLRTEVEVLERTALSAGSLLTLRAECFAGRASGDGEVRVLDWTFFAWSLQ